MNRHPAHERNAYRLRSCFARTLDLIARPHNPNADEMSDFVSGMSDEQWKDVAAIANSSHDCGVTHDIPSADTRMDIVNEFAKRAVQAERVQDRLAAELSARATRLTRPMKVLP